jgi:hypothetical protein
VRLFRRSWARAMGIRLLDALEALRLRRSWLRVASLCRRGAYLQGLSARGGRTGRRKGSLPIQIGGKAALPTPEIAASPVELAVPALGRRTAYPSDGQWHHEAFEPVLTRLDPDVARSVALDPGPEALAVDPARIEVILGSGRRARDTRFRDELEALGIRVTVLPRGRGWSRHWSGVDAAVRRSTADFVALPLPGWSPSAEWLASATVPFEGSRVAAVLGAPAPAGRAARPISLISPDRRLAPFEPPGLPPRFLLVRRSVYLELDGLDLSARAVGSIAPVLEFAERVGAAGHVLASCETKALRRSHLDSPRQHLLRWRRAQARAGLLALEAARIGGPAGWRWFLTRALVPRSRMLWQALSEPDPPLRVRGWLGGNLASMVGYALALASIATRSSARGDVRQNEPAPCSAPAATPSGTSPTTRPAMSSMRRSRRRQRFVENGRPRVTSSASTSVAVSPESR